jgi:hypothetical protein
MKSRSKQVMKGREIEHLINEKAVMMKQLGTVGK